MFARITRTQPLSAQLVYSAFFFSLYLTIGAWKQKKTAAGAPKTLADLSRLAVEPASVVFDFGWLDDMHENDEDFDKVRTSVFFGGFPPHL